MSYVLQRLLHAILVIAGALTLVFLILYWLPGDPADLVAGDGASDDTIAGIRAQLGTDKPLWVQYGHYLWRLAHGDLGNSFATSEPVMTRILSQLPYTIELALGVLLVSVLAGVTLGVTAAINQGRPIDRLIQSATLLGTTMPPFWFGMLLILLFSVTLHWFPALGDRSLKQLVLPVLTMSYGISGMLQRVVRSSVIEVLHEPFLNTLRGGGLHERAILFRHVLRNALIPVLTFLGYIMGFLLSGVVTTEAVFARRGLGRLLVEALGSKDIPVLQGVVLFAAFFFVISNLLIDLSYGVIDRRTRT